MGMGTPTRGMGTPTGKVEAAAVVKYVAAARFATAKGRLVVSHTVEVTGTNAGQHCRNNLCDP